MSSRLSGAEDGRAGALLGAEEGDDGTQEAVREAADHVLIVDDGIHDDDRNNHVD